MLCSLGHFWLAFIDPSAYLSSIFYSPDFFLFFQEPTAIPSRKKKKEMGVLEVSVSEREFAAKWSSCEVSRCLSMTFSRGSIHNSQIFHNCLQSIF